jgi:predicted Fe-Mo cluster-binding NifX family protein
MRRAAVMTSLNRPDAPLSSHFGKAEWVMVFDSAATQPSFFKNEELNGRGAMNIVIREHCSDVILAGIGEGAWGRLLAANVHAWIAPASVTGEQALQMLVRGELPPVSASLAHRGRGNHGYRSCRDETAHPSAVCCE